MIGVDSEPAVFATPIFVACGAPAECTTRASRRWRETARLALAAAALWMIMAPMLAGARAEMLAAPTAAPMPAPAPAPAAPRAPAEGQVGPTSRLSAPPGPGAAGGKAPRAGAGVAAGNREPLGAGGGPKPPRPQGAASPAAQGQQAGTSVARPPAAAPATVPAEATPGLPPPPSTETVFASSILGRPVLGPNDQEIGHVVDVLVDAAGVPRAAVVDFGGFMGVGNRRIAVDWAALRFPVPGSDAPLKLTLSEDEIKAIPQYSDPSRPVTVVGHAGPAPVPGP